MTTKPPTNCLTVIREARGMTQYALADLVGTTNVTISRYEKEDQRLNIPVMRRLAAALDCTVADIVGEGAFSRDEQAPQPERHLQVEPVSSLDVQLAGTLKLLTEQMAAREFDAALSFAQALAGLLNGAMTLGTKSRPSTTSTSSDGAR